MVFCYFLHRIFAPGNELLGNGQPLVSIFTPTFRTGERAFRAYRSLQHQTYDNWEWVVVDDSDDGGATFRVLTEVAQAEPRLSVHSLHKHSGKIGEVKRRACALSQGEILVELDHDDQLTPDALSDIVRTFQREPHAGFVYSNWAEVAEDSGVPLSYGDSWAFGYGNYGIENYNGRSLAVANAPALNAQTIRHIVGMPNHVRAWRRDAYWQIGGHNPGLHVADDYELLLRTFLHTHMVHIPKLCYIQYLQTGSNTQDIRRGEIQRLVRCFSEHYDRQIHERLLQLNLPDPVWDEGTA
jgi:glycosyltransferase involved in cell wall biosynthesis